MGQKCELFGRSQALANEMDFDPKSIPMCIFAQACNGLSWCPLIQDLSTNQVRSLGRRQVEGFYSRLESTAAMMLQKNGSSPSTPPDQAVQTVNVFTAAPSPLSTP